MEPVKVILAPEPTRVRLLARSDGQDLMKAVLAPLERAHRRAASTLMEALALWQQRPVDVVVCVDDGFAGHELGLLGGLGIGDRSVHYKVGVVYDRAPRRHTLAGVGDFRDLRRMDATEVLW